jgi:hypothetical protein
MRNCWFYNFSFYIDLAVGKHLVAYGGINEKGQYLDDLYGLNLGKLF